MTRSYFFKLTPIINHFPLRFSSGNQRWTSFIVTCNWCNKDIPENNTRGFVELEYDEAIEYRNLPEYHWHIESYSLCPECDKITRAIYDLYSDMTIKGKNPKTGKIQQWQARRLTRWEKFLEFIKNLLFREPSCRFDYVKKLP